MAVAVAIISLLLLVLMAIAVLLIKSCRKRNKKMSNSSSPHSSPGSNTLNNKAEYEIGLYGKSGGRSKIVPAPPTKMPKHIQMGTGFMSNSSNNSEKPDLLTDVSSSKQSNLSTSVASATISSEISAGTASASDGGGSASGATDASTAGSYRMAMENIIDDYR